MRLSTAPVVSYVGNVNRVCGQEGARAGFTLGRAWRSLLRTNDMPFYFFGAIGTCALEVKVVSFLLWTFGNPSDSVILVKVPDLVTQLGSSLFLWHGSMGQKGNGCYRMSQKHGFLSSLLNLFPLLPKSSQKTDDAF